jgi:hypothetical protein
MIWFILEGSLALLLFVFIIWWTLPRKRDVDKHNHQDSSPALTAEDAEEKQERGRDNVGR